MPCRPSGKDGSDTSTLRSSARELQVATSESNGLLQSPCCSLLFNYFFLQHDRRDVGFMICREQQEENQEDSKHTTKIPFSAKSLQRPS